MYCELQLLLLPSDGVVEEVVLGLLLLLFLATDFGSSDFLLLSLLIFSLPWLVSTLKGDRVTAFNAVGTVGVVDDVEAVEAVDAVDAVGVVDAVDIL